MKIIHTSDWHLGHKLYGYDRSEEQRSFLVQLKTIVREEQPDALIVSGDVFHTSNPTAETQTMFVESLLAIQQECPELVVVITAGNHDSYSRLEIDKSLWRLHNIHIIGNIAQHEDRSANYEAHIIPIGDKGYIAAVPHCYEQNFPPCAEQESCPRLEAFFKGLEKTLLQVNSKKLPMVLMAHLTLTGSDTTGHELNIGGIDSTPLAALGNAYDYIALGHIHRTQFIANSQQKARYSGTPLPVNFDEDFPHSVSMVEITKHGAAPRCTEIVIDNPHPLVNIPPVKDAVSFEQALQLLARFDDDTRAYIRLNVRTDNGYLPADCNEQAMEATKNKACRFCFINRIIEHDGTDTQSEPEIFIQKLQTMSDDDVINIAQLAMPLTEEQQTMMREAITRSHLQTNE